MFNKILLPLDLADKHQQALDIAGKLAAQGGGAVVLLHVIETIPGLSVEEERPFYDRLERRARSQLDQWGRRLEAQGVSYRTEVLFGHRVPECVRFAAETGVDLIILTAPRPDPNALIAGLGSMSHKIGLLSQCPVLLVK